MIPAQVRYAADLPAGAKLLYGEISSLTDARGYCFASNAYFCELYQISEPTVQRYLKALKSGGFIRIQDGDGGSGRRKIFAGINPLSDNPLKNEGVPDNPLKNEGGTPSKMTGTNNVINKKEEQKPPISPTAKPPKGPLPAELLSRVEQYAGADLELRDALIGFAESRAKLKKPIDTQRILTLLLSRLNELSGGSRMAKLAIINKATVSKWLSFYPLDGDEAPPSAGRTVEAPPGVATW